MATSNLKTLGGFAFSANGESSPGPDTQKGRALMAFLALNPHADLSRERLLEIFWPNVDPESGRNRLKTVLSTIRRCIEAVGLQPEQCLMSTKSVVRWIADTAVDAVDFRRLVAEQNEGPSARALALYRGDFLEGDYDEWATTEREHLARLYESQLAKSVRAARDPEAARLLIARNPYAEEAYVTLMEAELDAGRNTSAAAVMETFRSALGEVGERPSEEFEERFGHISARSLDLPPTNLPRQTTTFIGRDAELETVVTLIGSSPVVTIVGAGGVGKTRIALRAAARLLHTFDDGVWFADLATVDGEDAVVTEIASSLGVKSSGFGTLLEHVLARLRRTKSLLVLDNCEHVVFEAARVIETIIGSSPRVSVLATSRERTGVRGERIYRLPSLDVPTDGQKLSAVAGLRFGGVALFAVRAAESDASFTVTDDNIGAVIEICRHLDGIALAIELAAARVPTLSVHQLVKRLSKESRLLKGSERTAHPRHQTMRGAFDWSYEWLSEPEKALFRRAGIFRGGWTLETIDACRTEEELDEFTVLERLSLLVEKSLVAVTFRGRSQRYRLMEPLREYALALLNERGELGDVANRHASYFADFAKREGGKWLKIPDTEFVATVEGEIDNIRAALEWTLAQRNDVVLGAEIASSLGGYWFTEHYHEGLRWLNAAQAAVSYEQHPALSVDIALHRMRTYGQTDIAHTGRIAEEALATARTLLDERPLVRVEMFYGVALVNTMRLGEAEGVLHEALGLARRVDPYRLQYMLWGLAKLNRLRGNADAAKDFADRMMDAHNASYLPGDRNRWIILSERARELYDVEGRVDMAIEKCCEALMGTQANGDALGGIQLEYLLGAMLLRSDAAKDARLHALRILEMSENQLLPHGVAPAVHLLGGIAALEGRYEHAARLLGFARLNLGNQRHQMLVDVDPDWFVAPLSGRFEKQRLEALMAEGSVWTQQRAVEEALKESGSL